MLGSNIYCNNIILLLNFSVVAVCEAGKFSDGSATCSECEAGKFSAAGSATCSECKAGESSAAGSATCSECEEGTFSAAGSDSCSTCGIGKDPNSDKTDCGEYWDLNFYLVAVTYLLDFIDQILNKNFNDNAHIK